MIEIITEKGECFTFNPETERIFKDGNLIPSSEAEPIYSETPGPEVPPRFSGIWLKSVGIILSLSGKYSKISDPNSII